MNVKLWLTFLMQFPTSMKYHNVVHYQLTVGPKLIDDSILIRATFGFNLVKVHLRKNTIRCFMLNVKQYLTLFKELYCQCDRVLHLPCVLEEN